MYGMTAAHKTLPIPCYARITNLSNGRSVVVRINDRGPFVGNRIVDLSYSAATRLDIVRTGTAFVELRTVGPKRRPRGDDHADRRGRSGHGHVARAPSSADRVAPLRPSRRQPRRRAARGLRRRSRPPPPQRGKRRAVAAPVALYIQVGAFADEGQCAAPARAPAERRHCARVFAGAAPARAARCGGYASVRSRRVEEFDRLAAQLATLGLPRGTARQRLSHAATLPPAAHPLPALPYPETR